LRGREGNIPKAGKQIKLIECSGGSKLSPPNANENERGSHISAIELKPPALKKERRWGSVRRGIPHAKLNKRGTGGMDSPSGADTSGKK